MADATDAELISICTCGCERWDYDGTCHDCGKSRRELLLQSRIDALAARVAVLEGALRNAVRTCRAIADELRDEDEAKAAGALECALRFAALTA